MTILKNKFQNKYIRRNWYFKNTDTITLDDAFISYDDFELTSGIEKDNEEYESIYNQLFNLYNDVNTKWNTKDYLANHLRYHIENEYEKYTKVNEFWDKEIGRLYGEYKELNQFRIGDIKDDIENYDKYKSARQTELKQDNILNTIKSLQEMKTPFEKLIENIANRVFKVYNRPQEEIWY